MVTNISSMVKMGGSLEGKGAWYTFHRDHSRGLPRYVAVYHQGETMFVSDTATDWETLILRLEERHPTWEFHL